MEELKEMSIFIDSEREKKFVKSAAMQLYHLVTKYERTQSCSASIKNWVADNDKQLDGADWCPSNL